MLRDYILETSSDTGYRFLDEALIEYLDLSITRETITRRLIETPKESSKRTEEESKNYEADIAPYGKIDKGTISRARANAKKLNLDNTPIIYF